MIWFDSESIRFQLIKQTQSKTFDIIKKSRHAYCLCDSFCRVINFPGKEEGTKWVQVDGIVDKLSVSISGTVWAIMHDKVSFLEPRL